MTAPGTRTGTESARRVSDCVTALLRDQPFFGSLALRLPIRADAGRETLASDGLDIRYAPQWVADTDADLVKAAIGRVVLACALKHHTRRGERDPERWQHASQLVTHGLLRDAGFKLPPDAEAWDGISVEQAYDRLPEPRHDDGAGEGDTAPPSSAVDGGGDAPAPQSGGGGDEHADGDNSSDDDPAQGGDPQDQDAPGEGQDDAPQDEGSPGQDGDTAAPSFDPSGTGEVMDAAARDGADHAAGQPPVDINDEEQAWDEAMHQALNLAKAQGKAPGSVEETIRDAHASTLDWRTLLRRYMTDAAARDYSWSVPNRRFIDSGLYLPSIRSEGIDAIAVIIDTSGSVDAQALAAFWTEIREVATEIRPDSVIVLQVDAALQDAAEHAPGDLPEEIALRGRGGTDFRPGFAWLEERGTRPSLCLYFTDMDCDRYPDTEPAFPVLFCDWSEGVGLPRQPPPWGEHIKIGH